MEVIEIGAMNDNFNIGEKMDDRTKKMEELRSNISKWGKKNGITINGRVESQMLKLNSEASEISEAILKNDCEAFVDAIGDTFVVMVMVADILKRELESDELDLRMVGYDKLVEKEN
jgi:NTP pyrophosphatase (non-canonical NTP hydrolase)